MFNQIYYAFDELDLLLWKEIKIYILSLNNIYMKAPRFILCTSSFSMNFFLHFPHFITLDSFDIPPEILLSFASDFQVSMNLWIFNKQ